MALPNANVAPATPSLLSRVWWTENNIRKGFTKFVPPASTMHHSLLVYDPYNNGPTFLLKMRRAIAFSTRLAS